MVHNEKWPLWIVKMMLICIFKAVTVVFDQRDKVCRLLVTQASFLRDIFLLLLDCKVTDIITVSLQTT